MPHISVIMPCFNSEVTLEECLKSIRKSYYQDYELLVIDDKSTDKSAEIASKYADKVISHEKNLGRKEARNTGMHKAEGEILVCIDSDIVIKPDTLSIIDSYFQQHKEIEVITGVLSRDCPIRNFFTQYKNLYMNYIFWQQPDEVDFLFGSIFAIRRGIKNTIKFGEGLGEDTEAGILLHSQGYRIVLLKKLEVIHLKKYNIFSFFENDFKIPYWWAKLFIRIQGWKRLGKNKTGFSHSAIKQLISVTLAPIILLLMLADLLANGSLALVIFMLSIIWLSLNLHFLAFVAKERGLFFGIRSFFLTFVDHLFMASGIIFGFFAN